jgi:hypothetical protein
MHTQDAAIMIYRAKEAYQDAGVLSSDIDIPTYIHTHIHT